jgi:2,4-dienoyl-CoA reductase (NADPH2)
MAAAVVAARRGHKVVLFELAGEVGGQFNMAKRIPGKEEFHETLRYFARQLELGQVDIRLNTEATAGNLLGEGYDHIVIATGVTPRTPPIEGIDHPKVASYADILTGRAEAGETVAIVGAGGIGFDVAEFLAHVDGAPDVQRFNREWGIDTDLAARGGVEGVRPDPLVSSRQIVLLQRKTSKPGQGLGKTTGWIHRLQLRKQGVEALAGVSYDRIDDSGLHFTVGGESRVLDVDTVIICAGQEPMRRLARQLEGGGVDHTLVGGAFEARELDAKRAIDQATRVAASL